MKLFGHPVHPVFVHFPTALLPMDLAMGILYHTTGNESFYAAGFYCLAGGVLTGAAAILTGLIELVVIPQNEKTAISLALYHGVLNGLIVGIFAAVCWKAYLVFPQPYFSGLNAILIKSALILALFVGNYLGGRLIYRHHIGIKTIHHEATAT
jgi:uncharacterized membrane protein